MYKSSSKPPYIGITTTTTRKIEISLSKADVDNLVLTAAHTKEPKLKDYKNVRVSFYFSGDNDEVFHCIVTGFAEDIEKT